MNEEKYIPSISEVKELYQLTEGLARGILDCKYALLKSNGDKQKALKIIIERQRDGDILF